MISRSVNEVEMQLQKACRGAGLSMGHAQVIAAILVCDIKALGCFLDCLSAKRCQSVVSSVAPYQIANADPLIDGPVIRDALLSGAGAVEIRGLVADDFCACLFRGADIKVEGDCITVTGIPTQNTRPKRLEVSDADWAKLDGFAKCIYVPETAESRLAGAGAGLTDND